MNAIRKIGILGLGAMGAPMARHLVAKGYNVAGHDPVDTARRAAPGISIVDSPREVAKTSDLVIVVVGFDHDVEHALFGAGGVMEAARPGLVIAIGSTIAPRHAKQLAERAAKEGVVLLASVEYGATPEAFVKARPDIKRAPTKGHIPAVADETFEAVVDREPEKLRHEIAPDRPVEIPAGLDLTAVGIVHEEIERAVYAGR